MSNPIANKASMVRNFRKFPEDIKPLTTELTRGWQETANAVNDRVIGFFTTAPTLTGKQYFYNGKKLSSLQQMWSFGAITPGTSFLTPHNINTINQIVLQYGWLTDSSGNWYPLPYVNIVAANQISIYTTPTDILITSGAGAPSITSGSVVLEWLQNS